MVSRCLDTSDSVAVEHRNRCGLYNSVVPFVFVGDSGIGGSSSNNDSIASESVPSSATERRAVVLSSAGKKLPWDPNPPSNNMNNNLPLNHMEDHHDHLPNGFKVFDSSHVPRVCFWGSIELKVWSYLCTLDFLIHLVAIMVIVAVEALDI